MLGQSINVIENYHRNWETINGELISAVRPPTIPIKVESSNSASTEQGFLEATAYIKPSEANSNNDKNFKQNNFTNLNLQTMSSQLIKIENQVNQIRDKQENKEEIYPTIIRPPLPMIDFKLRNPNKNKELVEELTN